MRVWSTSSWLLYWQHYHNKHLTLDRKLCKATMVCVSVTVTRWSLCNARQHGTIALNSHPHNQVSRRKSHLEWNKDVECSGAAQQKTGRDCLKSLHYYRHSRCFHSCIRVVHPMKIRCKAFHDNGSNCAEAIDGDAGAMRSFLKREVSCCKPPSEMTACSWVHVHRSGASFSALQVQTVDMSSLLLRQ